MSCRDVLALSENREKGQPIMITSEHSLEPDGVAKVARLDRRPMCRRPARTMLIAALASAAALSPMTAPVAFATTSTGNVISAVPIDWRHAWQDGNNGAAPNSPGSGYGAAAIAVTQPATAAQSKGVVMINTELPYQGASGAGTGIVLTAAGQVLTSYHVVEGAGVIKVTVAETGRTYQATVVGRDQADDVALLQLKGASGLNTVKIDDDKTVIGDKVTAVGNANGNGTLSAAKGKILSLDASITTASEGPVASETLTAMIETTADVVSGDSGGPLFDSDGEATGIDTAASSGSEINGFAVPVHRALDIVQQIQSGKESSNVRVGPAAFLGVELGNASGGADSGYPGTGFQESGGAMIESVVSDTAADAAGLEAGDEITAFGGHIVASAEDVTALLADHDPGDRVKIIWIDQSGSDHTATVTLGASPVA
jgi:S1-C subfamily serine protease